jgi:hypothetical protein
MKKLILTVLVLLPLFDAFAQGILVFANYGGGVHAPVYESDGVTKLSGPQFQAELLAGPSLSGLTALATTPFYTGTLAGYFNGGQQTINGILWYNPAWVQVKVWSTASGTTFDQAQASGLPDSWWATSVFTVILGGGVVNPSPPAALTGLGVGPLYLNSIPEPSTVALAALGAAALLLHVRRRH